MWQRNRGQRVGARRLLRWFIAAALARGVIWGSQPGTGPGGRRASIVWGDRAPAGVIWSE